MSPFRHSPDAAAKRVMRIKPNEISIEEVHELHGLKTKVTYFHIPGESFAALVRHVEVTNLSDREVSFELLDGIPEILPFGVENGGFKEVGHLLRSWMEVENQDNLIPFYKVRSSTHDEAEVSAIDNGHFYLSFSDEEELIRPIVDPELVFGENSSLSYPDVFAATPWAELSERKQYAYNKVPCGFTGKVATLAAHASMNLYTLIGHISKAAKINHEATRLCSSDYIARKLEEARHLVEELTSDIATHTGMPVIDAYSRQCYLDNFLRGGYPFIFGGKDGTEGAVVHLFSRKHGDLERDYNFFSLLPEVYSQGNGNFRDANQNRRSDVFFNPRIGTFNIKMFFSLMQADGYNPLGVEGTTFQVEAANIARLRALLEASVSSGQAGLEKLCVGKFTPGKLIGYLSDAGITLLVEEEQFLNQVLALSQQNIEASFNEGYWSDHWTYNMDLIDNYLAVFPDKKQELLFDDATYTFFDSPVFVLPRSEKYVLKAGAVRQYGSLKHDTEKMKRLGIAQNDTNWLRTEDGTGSIYRTNLLVKILSLSLNKFATLDPYGMGIEMEANKPGWNDAMNGLPGIVGSGMSEALELKRIVSFLVQACLEAAERTVSLPEEIHQFLQITANLAKRKLNGELDSFTYWDLVASAREAYRSQVRFGITGAEKLIALSEVQEIFASFERIVETGLAKAVGLGNGLVPTYFRFEATEFAPVLDELGQPVISEYGLPKAQVKAFQAIALPHFLEAPARWLKTVKTTEEARSIHHLVKGTDLYDPELHMFKTSVSLEGETHEIGRIRAFTAGWLERESVFMHMSYKYVLGLLKSGLYEEYEEEMRHSLVPFLD
ncbi:MAG: cellobiose phosphorylase, partial [Gorillibacterium sp.]|nr:cellobiose phosphorylase [Gorillibacterium sp.]